MKQFWTKDEMDKLAEMAAQGKTNAQIAAALCRSVGSVAHKRARLFRDAEQYMTEGTVSRLFEGTAGAPEDFEEPDGEGTTELEREIRFQASVIDTLSNDLKAYRGQIEGNLATVLERTNELTQDATLMRDTANGLTKAVNALMDGLYIVELWLSQSCFYRLTHSFRKFRETKSHG